MIGMKYYFLMRMIKKPSLYNIDMPRKPRQKQKQSQKQNVKQTVIVKVGETGKRRRRRSAPKKRTEEPINMQMSLPPPVIYQTGPAFDAPRLQAFQDFEYPRFTKAGEAAMLREEEAPKKKVIQVPEDIGLSTSEILERPTKKEQLKEFGDLVPTSSDEFSINSPFGISTQPAIATAVATELKVVKGFPESELPAQSIFYKKAPKGYYSESESDIGSVPIRRPKAMKEGPVAPDIPVQDNKFRPNAATLNKYIELTKSQDLTKDQAEQKFLDEREAWRQGEGRPGARKSELTLNKKTNSRFIEHIKQVSLP
jgi:hypothetical protein